MTILDLEAFSNLFARALDLNKVCAGNQAFSRDLKLEESPCLILGSLLLMFDSR